MYDKKENLEEFKQVLQERSRMPGGIVTDAELSVNTGATELERLLKRKTKEKTPLQRYKDFIKDEYDGIQEQVKQESVGTKPFPEESSHFHRGESSSSVQTKEDDLPDDIKQAFLRTMERTLAEFSGYTIAFSIKLYKLMILFRNSTISADGSYVSTTSDAVDPPISDIFPNNYPIEAKENEFFPPHINEHDISDETLKKQFDDLFSQKYFFRAVLANAFQDEERNQHITDTYVMKIVLDQYLTNFEDVKRNRKIEDQISVQEDEEDMRAKYDIEADVNYNVALEVLEEEDEFEDETDDVSRARLMKLRAVICEAIYKAKHANQSVDIKNLEDAFTSITPQESRVSKLICDFLLPYVPKKEKRYCIPHMLPFLFMSNDVFRCSGYRKYQAKMLPLQKVNSLSATNIDASTLFSLFATSSTGQNMDFFDFDKRLIVSRQKANEPNNDPKRVFFDLKKLKKVCGGYKMTFAHSMRLLPGLRIVRVFGYKLNIQNEEREQKKPSKTRVAKKDDKKADITEYQQKLNDLVVKVRELSKERRDLYQKFNVRKIKRGWKKAAVTEEHKENNQVIYHKVKLLKAEQYKTELKLVQAKEDLQQAKRQLQLLRSANIETEDPVSKKRNIDNTEYVDNGLVSMTETVKFTPERFRFHLKLYNHFSALVEGKIEASVFDILCESNPLKQMNNPNMCLFRKKRRISNVTYIFQNIWKGNSVWHWRHKKEKTVGNKQELVR
ncbi:hypothetical protein EDC94DRAFT_658813 [Helicostylum pulchrum]|nr:hypothetical protein EDC94DRAFT_658813 [Helicostylum pulchrum]